MLRKAGGWGRRKGGLTLRWWRRRTACKCSRIHKGILGLSPEIDKFIPGRIAEAFVLLKRSNCTNEATPLGLLSASRSGVPEGKNGHIRKSEESQEEILLPVSITGKKVRLVLSEWFFEGAAGRVRTWSDSHRTFGSMGVEGRQQNLLLACLRNHELRFGGLEKFVGKMHTSCGHGDNWNVHCQRKGKGVSSR